MMIYVSYSSKFLWSEIFMIALKVRKLCDPDYENYKFLDHGNLELYSSNNLYIFVNSVLLTGSEC